jgi:hypothetical protein
MNNEAQARNFSLDLLKGVLIILACCEHFSSYINYLFIEYFNEGQILSLFQRPNIVSNYKYLLNYSGKFINADEIQQVFHTLFIPWVSHLYIAIAGYNLARHDYKNTLGICSRKVKLFFLLFIFFSFENFLVSPNLGAALSIYPIQMWFIVLSSIAILSKFFSDRFILLIYILLLTTKFISNSTQIILLDSYSIDTLIKVLHPWSFSTEFLMFMLSGLTGFLYARYSSASWFFSHKNFSIGSGVVLILTTFICWDKFRYNENNIYEYEEFFNNINVGVFFIISIIIFSLSLVRLINIPKVPPVLNFLTYLGKHSLWIFLFHRVFFYKILFPLKVHLFSFYQLPITNLWWEILIYFMITVFIYNLLMSCSRIVQKIRKG